MPGPAAIAALISAAKTAKEAYDGVVKILPLVVEECDCVVYGSPQSSKNDLYWLAVAAAFGKVSNKTISGLLLPKGHILLEYNAESNWVRFNTRQITTWDNIYYTTWKYNQYLERTFGPLRARGISTPSVGVSVPLMYGPSDIHLGGEWQWYSSLTPGLPGDVTSVDKTGWEGETILTNQPTYGSPSTPGTFASLNPYPDGDGVSRGANSIAAAEALKNVAANRLPEYLVIQALSQPCNPEKQLPSNRTVGGKSPALGTAATGGVGGFPNAYEPSVLYPGLLSGPQLDVGPTGPQPDKLPPV